MKISKSERGSTVTMSTTERASVKNAVKWWKAKSKDERANQLVGSAAFLKDNQGARFQQAAVYARLYGNASLFNFLGSNTSRLTGSGMPVDRPTFNLVQSAIDTLVSRIGQSRPTPIFLTDNSNYKERNLAKKLNTFILGEFYNMKAYEKGVIMLRDALVEGTGCLKIYRTNDDKVGAERVLLTDLYVDPNESIYGEPRQIYQIKLVDRAVLMEECPEYRSIIERAENAYAQTSADSASKSIADQVMVVEGWHLPSGKNAKDGRHSIALTSGMILDEEYTKERFPFVFMHYCPRLLGFWAQGLSEQLMGTQMEINQLLYTITKSIKLVGVPRVFLESGSKVNKAAQNNDVGVIVEYKGVKPSYEVAPCVAPELYAQLQRLIDYGYQQCGVSALQASSVKPAGLNSGEAIRSYDDIATDRFNSLSRRYDNAFIDLAYLVIETAKEIAMETGFYKTVYPHKNGIKEIDLTKADIVKDSYVIQCFNQSSLPREPAGRLQKVTEMITSGMLTLQEGRRLLDFPDLDQMETLANAAEERIFQCLDEIVESGKFTGPDPFTNFSLAEQHVVAYINLYSQCKLEEEKMQMLRDYFDSIQTLKQAALTPPPAPEASQGGVPTPQVAPPPAQVGVNSAA